MSHLALSVLSLSLARSIGVLGARIWPPLSLSLPPSDHPYIPPLCRSFSRFDSSTPALVFTGPLPVPPTFVLVRCRNRASEPSKQASRSRIPAEGGGRRKEGGRSIGSAAAAKDRADETRRGNSSSSSLFNLAAVC